MGNAKTDDLESPTVENVDQNSIWSDSGCNSSVVSEMESELILEAVQTQDFKVNYKINGINFSQN